MADWWRKHVRMGAHRGHRTAYCKLCNWHGSVDRPDALERLEELVAVHLYRSHQILPPLRK